MTIPDKINLAIAVLVGISMVATVCYTIVTFCILRATRAQVSAITRPYIQITPQVRSGTQLITLLIKNAGNTSARRMRLRIDRDFFAFGEIGPDRNIARYPAFSKEIESFPPRAEMIFNLGVGPALLADDAKTPRQFAVSAQYGFDDVTVKEVTTIDLEPFVNAAVPVDPLVEAVNRLSASVGALQL